MSERLPNRREAGGGPTDGADETGDQADRSAERSLRADGGRQLSEYLRALAHPRRRRVLYYLRDHEHAEFEEIVEHVADREAQTTTGESEEVRRSVRIDLHHAQLPLLEAAGTVSYDHRNGSLRYHHSETLERLLECCRPVELPGKAEE